MTSTNQSEPTPEQVLDLPMDPADNGAGADTVRGYLVALLAEVWQNGECSSRPPFGRFGWPDDLYRLLITGGYVQGELNDGGWVDELDEPTADRLIVDAIKTLARPSQSITTGLTAPPAGAEPPDPDPGAQRAPQPPDPDDEGRARDWLDTAAEHLGRRTARWWHEHGNTDPATAAWPVTYIDLATRIATGYATLATIPPPPARERIRFKVEPGSVPLAHVREHLSQATALEADDCRRCEGSGQLANTTNREPWPAWQNLPAGSDFAVRFGIVKPIPCNECDGTGKHTTQENR